MRISFVGYSPDSMLLSEGGGAGDVAGFVGCLSECFLFGGRYEEDYVSEFFEGVSPEVSEGMGHEEGVVDVFPDPLEIIWSVWTAKRDITP